MGGENGGKPGVSKVRRNFNRVARDLDRARRIAGMNGLQAFLWDEARELCWSFGNDGPRPFRFQFAAMERISSRPFRGGRKGCRRESLSRECRSMIERKFFVPVGDGTLLINKDYRQWLDDDGSPLFDDEQINWCRQIIQHDRTVMNSSRDRDEKITVDRDEKVTVRDEKVTVGLGCTVMKRSRSCDEKVTAQFERNAPGDDRRLEESPPRGRGRARAPEISSAPESADDPPFATIMNGSIHPEEPTPLVANDPAEVERVAAFAEERFPMSGFASLARSACGDFKASWVREAVEIGHASEATSWRFMEKVLKRFKAKGRSDSEKTPARASPKLTPPVPAHPVHVAPPDSPRRKESAAVLRRKMMGDDL